MIDGGIPSDTSVTQTLDDFGAGFDSAPPATDSPAAIESVVDDGKPKGAAGGGAISETSAARAPTDGSMTPEGAWQRGRADAQNGAQRKAIPGEYRDDRKLWKAWLDGYDKIPLSGRIAGA